MDDMISRKAVIDAVYIQSDDDGWWTGTVQDMEELLKGLPSVQPDDAALHESCTDCPLYDRKNHNCPRFNRVIPTAIRDAQPEKDAYMKAVYTWLLDYQIKAAELKGRYTPYEVLSWVVNDWRKEHE